MWASSILSIDTLCMYEHHVICAINVAMDVMGTSSMSGGVVFKRNVNRNG